MRLDCETHNFSCISEIVRRDNLYYVRFNSSPILIKVISNMIETGTLIATICSTIISFLAVFISYYTFKRTIKNEVRPVLIFTRRSATLWQIQNIGKGPAIQVVIGEKLRYKKMTKWGTVANCYPIAANAEISLTWIEDGFEFATVYTDIHGESFSTHFKAGRNMVYDKNLFPKWVVNRHEWLLNLEQGGTLDNRLTEADLEGKTAFELDIIRNEPYARYGYRFKREDLLQHFSSQVWYQPTNVNQFYILSQLSDSDKYNTQFILEYQLRTGKTLSANLHNPLSLLGYGRQDR